MCDECRGADQVYRQVSPKFITIMIKLTHVVNGIGVRNDISWEH